MVAKALVIGINYTGTAHELTGCIRDAKLTCEKLKQHLGLCDRDIILLLDEPGQKLPTRAHILEALRLLQVASHRTPFQPLWISYSGHGSYQEDDGTGRDEADHKDEMWLPCDFETTGPLLDDTICSILKKVHPQTTIVGLSDSCHSGTMFDLPFLGQLQATTQQLVLTQTAPLWPAPTPRIILLSACRDNQTATEVPVAPQLTQGVMTTAFWQVLEQEQGHVTCARFLELLRLYMIQQGHSQIPQFSATEPLVRAHFSMNTQTRPFLPTFS
jgi:hypothetical protein